jgi:prevent-host-death family protein
MYIMSRRYMMVTLTAVKARAKFSEVVSQAAFEKERIVLTRNGKELAAVVPVEDVRLLEAIEDRADIEQALRVLASPDEKPIAYKTARKALGLE